MPAATILQPRSFMAWSPATWESIRLRTGPDYSRNKRKEPTAKPLVQCVGVHLNKLPSKLFGDGKLDAAFLPAKVVTAAAEPTPPQPTPGAPPPPLPRYLVVTWHMPRYQGRSADGPTLRCSYVFAVPAGLRHDPSDGAAMLCEFLDGGASGHADATSRFYDRFKCIARLLSPDLEKVANRGAKGMLVRRLSRYFNGKPMLWRFFGVWGNCVRCGAAQFINMDFCSGGAIKNAAFFEGLKYLHKERIVWELSFTLEARTDDEMPERLLGGAAIATHAASFGEMPVVDAHTGSSAGA